jgi:hypothetical protein
MKKRYAKLLGLIAVLAALHTSPAMAGQFNAVVNGKSYHFNSTYDWNENNSGLGIEHEFSSTSAWRTTVMANGFRDSTDTMSYMAGGGLHRRLFETDRLSGTREDVNDSKPFPGILPSVSVGNDKVGFNLTYLPRAAVESTTSSTIVDPTISGILFIQFKVRLDQLLP